MKNLFLFLILSVAFFSHAQSAAYPARFKGLTKVENVLSARIGLEGGAFDLGSYLGVARENRTGSLVGLLGTINNGTFRNGDPNGINFLLWYLALESFSHELILTCKGSAPANISPNFREILSELCATELWPEEKTQTQLLKLWTEVMSYEAPNTEEIKWSQEVTQFQGTNAERLKFGLMLIFMNPYFLLEE
jgi:hypothetical protein